MKKSQLKMMTFLAAIVLVGGGCFAATESSDDGRSGTDDVKGTEVMNEGPITDGVGFIEEPTDSGDSTGDQAVDGGDGTVSTTNLNVDATTTTNSEPAADSGSTTSDSSPPRDEPALGTEGPAPDAVSGETSGGSGTTSDPAGEFFNPVQF